MRSLLVLMALSLAGCTTPGNPGDPAADALGAARQLCNFVPTEAAAALIGELIPAFGTAAALARALCDGLPEEAKQQGITPQSVAAFPRQAVSRIETPDGIVVEIPGTIVR